MELTKPTRPLLTYGTYPALAVVTAVMLWAAVHWDLNRDAIIGILTALTIATVFTVERLNPLQDRWSMTKASFLGRDLPFIGLAVVVEQVATAAVSLIAASTMPHNGFGPMSHTPLIAQAAFALVAQDLLWYAYHRTSHALPRLWRIHGLHHAPSQLYVLMHQVFHPFDLLVSRFLISLIVFKATGIAPDAAFIAIAAVGLQQTVSHVNSDLRVGKLNYVLIGTETHRYHHAAQERGNYGSAVAIWDVAFGTFLYEPRRVPGALGLENPESFPDPRSFHAALAWPFRRSRSAAVVPSR